MHLKGRKVDLKSANDGGSVADSEQTPRSRVPAANASEGVGVDIETENEATRDAPNDAQKVSTPMSVADDIQILNLHGQNPVVSYQNQIYHCTWSDMVGTAMFFSKAELGTEEEALMSTPDFRLLDTSRIKLIGQKATLTGKPGKKRRLQAEDESSNATHSNFIYDEEAPVIDGRSLGDIRTSNPRTNAGIKRQAAFLEKLMNVKRAKGESDNVRTVFSQKKGNTKIIQTREMEAGGSRQRQKFPSIAREIEELNRRVVRGDVPALLRLQDIYSSMEDDTPNQSSQQQLPMAAGQTHGASATPAIISEESQASIG